MFCFKTHKKKNRETRAKKNLNSSLELKFTKKMLCERIYIKKLKFADYIEETRKAIMENSGHFGLQVSKSVN